MASARFRNEVSRHGHALDALKSCLQKAIRRCDEDTALYAAGEIWTIVLAELGGGTRSRVRTNLARRLIVIFLEDAGVSEQSLAFLRGFWHAVHGVQHGTPDEAATQLHAVVAALARLPKGRMMSHWRAAAGGSESAVAACLDDPYNFEDHTLEVAGAFGGSENTVAAHLDDPYNHGDLVPALVREAILGVTEPRDLTPLGVGRFYRWAIGQGTGVKAWRAISAELQRVTGQLASEFDPYRWFWSEIGKNNEGFMCWMFPLLAALWGVRASECEPPSPEPDDDWVRGLAPRELPEWAIDLHTKAGRARLHKQKAAGFAKFRDEGALVRNESPWVNPMLKKFYNACKEIQEEAARDLLETAEFRLLFRAQLVTSAGKTDVYFAKDRHKRTVVVKGPLPALAARRAMSFASYLALNQLPFRGMRAIQMVPDRWPEGTPLGLRNQCDRRRPAWFLVARVIGALPPQRLHSSKLWPETAVADWEAAVGSRAMPPPDHLTPAQRRAYTEAILFRYVMGVPDFAARNFHLSASGNVYILDYDGEHDLGFTREQLHQELKRKRVEMCREQTQAHDFGEGWVVPEWAQARLREVQEGTVF